MALQTYRFSEIVQNIATAMQASATAALNFTPGSVFRAISESVAGVALWLQAIILQLLTLTRAATSIGSDLDTWMADYGLSRLSATPATGFVTFTRFSTGQPALIPFGATVQSADGTQSFAVTANSSSLGYTPSGYALASGVNSLAVPVAAVNKGVQGNVQAGTVTVLTTPIPYVDSVNNTNPIGGGIDAESDPAFRTRFFLFIASLSKATRTAVQYAVKSVQQGLTATITENQAYDGTPNPGFFYVVVDDGSGTPATSLINGVTAAIDAIRPISIPFQVYAPQAVSANVSMALTTAPNVNHTAVTQSVANALASYINAIPLGQSLPYSRLASIAYGVAGVTNAANVLLNGTTADLAANQKQKVVAGTVAVS